MSKSCRLQCSEMHVILGFSSKYFNILSNIHVPLCLKCGLWTKSWSQILCKLNHNLCHTHCHFSYFFPEPFSPNQKAPLQLITLFTHIRHSCSAHMLPWCQATWQLCTLPKPVCQVKCFNRHTELASNSACSLAVPALRDMWKFDTLFTLVCSPKPIFTSDLRL